MNIICFHDHKADYGFLSNWYLSDFGLDGIAYSSMEQFMMFQKARYFNDTDIAAKILQTSNVSLIKKLGREVSNYDESYWNGIRQIVVYRGLLAKFSQNAALKQMLLSTGESLLVECAVKDHIWGNGLSMTDPNRFDTTQWQGENLLGYTLMMVREELRSIK